MRDKLFNKLLSVQTITLPEYARTFLGVKYTPSIEPMIIATLQMDNRFEIKEGRINLTKEAEKNSFKTPLIVLDTETTGISHYDNHIIEFAAIKVEDSRITDSIETFINPQRSIPPMASKINGITDAMVENAPTFKEFMPQFLEFLGKGIFVAHNANFDWRFLNTELKRSGGEELSNRRMCTIELLKLSHPGLPTYKMDFLSEHFKTKVKNTHRALADVEATVEIMLQALPKISKHQLKKLIK